MTPRHGTAGVTLIEMLVALAISALIGLASFIFLESVSRTETTVAGRLERLALQDRAFQLLSLDAQNAIAATLGEALVLQFATHTVTWRATGTGLQRDIAVPARPLVTQHILEEPAVLTRHAPGILSLTLPNADLWHLVALPPPPAPKT